MTGELLKPMNPMMKTMTKPPRRPAYNAGSDAPGANGKP